MGYIRRTYNWLTRWGILPRPGGLDNQYLAWVMDMEQMSVVDREVHDEWLAHTEEDKVLNGTSQ
jgi:hypothetical protein